MKKLASLLQSACATYHRFFTGKSGRNEACETVKALEGVIDLAKLEVNNGPIVRAIEALIADIRQRGDMDEKITMPFKPGKFHIDAFNVLVANVQRGGKFHIMPGYRRDNGAGVAVLVVQDGPDRGIPLCMFFNGDPTKEIQPGQGVMQESNPAAIDQQVPMSLGGSGGEI